MTCSTNYAEGLEPAASYTSLVSIIRLCIAASMVSLVLSSCGSSRVDASNVPELPAIDAAGISELLEMSEQPVLVNVWASWCVPCRSEAPLIEAAFAAFGDDVRFVGINVRDTQPGARSFIAEFGTTTELGEIEHFFDPSGDIPVALGGTRGVPLTFFFEPGGQLAYFQPGVIDERTLALQIDELLERLR